MLVALQAVFVEQAAYDGGALRLGHLLTGLEDPPFAQTELHRVPKTDLPHGQLSDPRWLTAALGYLKDIESMGEKANRFTRGVNPSQSLQDDSAHPAPKVPTQKAQKGLGRWRGGVNLPFNHFPHEPSSDGVRERPMDSNKLPPYISSLTYGIDLLKVLSGCRNPLGNFIHQSKVLQMMRDSHCLSKDPWPCSGRRRSRLRLRVVVRAHLRVFVASCNWLVTGRPKKVTMEGLTRQPTISSCQSRMLESLEQSLRIWYRQGSGLCTDLQRSEQKFTSLREAIEELGSTCKVCKGLLASFDPYSRPRGQKDHPRDDRVVASEKPATCKSRSDITAVELNPDRLKFTSSPSF